MILICTNEIAGSTGYHKSVVELANGLHRAGYPVAVLGFLGGSDGSGRMLPLWPLDADIPAFALQTLAADGGALLHRNYHPAFTARLGGTAFDFTANQLAALRQLNAALTAEDTILFTAPIPASVFHQALDGEPRRAKTVLQIHNDYRFHDGLWDMLMESRPSIDRLQTVADGQRGQFLPTFDDADVVFVPNFPGENGRVVELAAHEGVNIALPASFQHRKNQLDAVRALGRIADESVHLTLWGALNRLNPYVIAVQHLVEELGLTERVHFPGFGSEADVYSTADIVLMTSLSEGFPYPLIEAMYQGRPTVSYDFEFGPREAIEDGGSGYIVPLGDVEQLAGKLTELTADERLRGGFGVRARQIFDERFSADAVAERYRGFLGPAGSAIDLTRLFATNGPEPIAIDAVSHHISRSRGRALHQVSVVSVAELYDIQIDNGERIETLSARRLGNATQIEFHADGAEVISYATAPGSADRHYLANTTGSELEVLPYLRRGASYGNGTPPVTDTIFAATSGAKRITVRELTTVLAALAKHAPRDVAWKIRQLTASTKPAARSGQTPIASTPQQEALPAGAPSTSASAPATAPRPTQQDHRGSLARAVGLPTATLGSVGRVVAAIGTRATALVVLRVATNRATPTRREVARHPWFPVTAGVDSFGTPVNRPGGVEIRNAGSARRPTVSIRGEYDWLLIRDAASERRITPPFGYGEMFERILTAERDHGLFDITTADGIHPWELGRSALIIQLAEAFGLWGAASAIGTPVQDTYNGPKRLTTAPRARRVVFDYARRGQSSYRTAAYRNDETMFVVQPEPAGYPEVTDTNLVYPFHEFNRWRQDWRRRWAQLRAPEIDARPFEEALTDALGIRVDLGNHLRSRMLKFLDERDFWTPVFERVRPEEVMIASSHWWAGIAAAATRSGAQVSDIQYALTSRYAPSFWFGGNPRYGATRFYTWSEFWAARTNAYQEHVVVPRQQPEFAAAESRDVGEPLWDVCVISQPRVLRRILAFVRDLVRERPELKVVIAPHPAQRSIIAGELATAELTGKVTIAPDDTLTTIGQSELCVGTFSTSLWEAAALGRPSYVIPVPGYEETLQDIESGLFRLAASPHDLVPYEVPELRRTIFGPV